MKANISPEIIERKHDLIRALDKNPEDTVLKEKLKEIDNYIRAFNSEALKKEPKMEEFKMSEPESVVIEKKRKVLLKDQISDKEEEAYQAIKNVVGDDNKVLVGVTLRLLKRFREQKKDTKAE